MNKLIFTNNATTTLGSAASSSTTTITVATGSGNEFPSPAAGQYFSATLWAAGSTTGEPNEIVYVTARSGDTMTVLRGQEGTTAQSWNVGDTFANYPTAAFYNGTASETDLQSQFGNSGNDTGIANAGVVTLIPAPTSFNDLLLSPIRVLKGGSANSGSFTLNVNGLGPTAVTYQGLPLAPGMLKPNQVYEVVYDGTQFELLNPNLTGVYQYADNTTAGSYSVAVPSWASHADVQIVGGGGGGAGSATGFSGGGGGGGAYVVGRAAVTAGGSLSVIVGGGGGGTSGSGTANPGGTSSISGIGTATGGGGGAAGSPSSAGGPGGSGSTSVGLRMYAGGYGGDGNALNAGNQGGNGAPGPFGGGGRTGAGGGLAGPTPGSGGGGSYNAAGAGGNGAPGAVLITFLP